MAVNKVVYDGKTLIDLTSDTVTEDKLLVGTTAHDKAGNLITGTHEELDISVETAEYTSGLDTQDDLIDQIAAVLESQFVAPETGGVIFDKLQSKSVTPTTSKQTITADAGYDALSSVIVEAIPQSYADQVYQNGYDDGNEAGYEAGYNEAFNLFKPYNSEVSFLESSGTQRIDTGISYSAENEYVIETECEWLDAAGTFTGWNAGGQFGNYGGYWGAGSSTSKTSIAVNGWASIRLIINAGTSSDTVLEVTQNGETSSATRAHSSMSSYTKVNYPIFAFSSDSGAYVGHVSARIKVYKIYVNGKLVRDYIPVIDKANVPCLYDKVTRSMYYNVGTGKFIAGAVVAV